MKFAQTLVPGKVGRLLAIIALYLAIQSLVYEYLIEQVIGDDEGIIVPFLDLFSVNAEQTIPTWYASILLLASATMLGVIAAVKVRTGDPYARHWVGLSLIFLYLSVDEGAVIHELFSDPLATAFNTSGYLAFGWLILFVPLLLIFALLYLRFLFHLPPRIRQLFILAGLFYVGGAVVVEAIGANRYSADGGVTFPYLAIATVEELLEMWGVVLFIYALLSYLVREGITAVVTPASKVMEAAAGRSLKPRYLGLMLAIVVILCNSAVVVWAVRQSPGPVSAADTRFYQLVNDRYRDQGVVILGINEAITADNPAAAPIAAALLTLFDDVMVIYLPDAQVSVAFAGQRLPISPEMLAQLAEQSGESGYRILDVSALREVAALARSP